MIRDAQQGRHRRNSCRALNVGPAGERMTQTRGKVEGSVSTSRLDDMMTIVESMIVQGSGSDDLAVSFILLIPSALPSKGMRRDPRSPLPWQRRTKAHSPDHVPPLDPLAVAPE